MADKRQAPDHDVQRTSSKRQRPNEDIQDAIAKAKARAAELSASLKKKSAPADTTAMSKQDRIAMLKAQIASKTSSTTATPPDYIRGASLSPPAQASDSESSSAPIFNGPRETKTRGGLSIGLHPSLMGDAQTMPNKSKEGSKAVDKPPDQLDLTVPSTEELKKDPYFDSSISGAAGKARKAKALIFSQHGKYMQQAAGLRRQAQLEEMKNQIADRARKAGLREDRTNKSFAIEDVPDCDWWDEGLVTNSQYPDFDEDAMEATTALIIHREDSIITQYVQHPVLIVPPQEKRKQELKPLPLTKKELAKKRRQERSEKLKEKQAEVKLGLVPPDPPKVRLQTMMRILGEQAVRDPTAMEAQVKKQVAERQQKHEEENAARKLSKEQRHNKLEVNQEKDATRGLYLNVYRIDDLAFGGHRYKIDINAKQQGLTGITILNPKFNLVIVEGGSHSIKKFNRLMLHRIDWTENAKLTATAQNRRAESHQEDPINQAQWLDPIDSLGNLKDLSQNSCRLVWAGEVKDRVFKIWRNRVCETEAEAKGVLERAKMETMWQLAKGSNEEDIVDSTM